MIPVMKCGLLLGIKKSLHIVYIKYTKKSLKFGCPGSISSCERVNVTVLFSNAKKKKPIQFSVIQWNYYKDPYLCYVMCHSNSCLRGM